MKPVWPKLASDIAGMAEPAPRRPCQARPRASARSGVRSRVELPARRVEPRARQRPDVRAPSRRARHGPRRRPVETRCRRGPLRARRRPGTAHTTRPRDSTIARSNRSPRSVAAVGAGVRAAGIAADEPTGRRDELRRRARSIGEAKIVLEDLRQEQDVEVAVDDALPRNGLRLDARERAPVGDRTFAEDVERVPGRQPRGVGQQALDRDAVEPGRLPLRAETGRGTRRAAARGPPPRRGPRRRAASSGSPGRRACRRVAATGDGSTQARPAAASASTRSPEPTTAQAPGNEPASISSARKRSSGVTGREPRSRRAAARHAPRSATAAGPAGSGRRRAARSRSSAAISASSRAAVFESAADSPGLAEATRSPARSSPDPIRRRRRASSAARAFDDPGADPVELGRVDAEAPCGVGVGSRSPDGAANLEVRVELGGGQPAVRRRPERGSTRLRIARTGSSLPGSPPPTRRGARRQGDREEGPGRSPHANSVYPSQAPFARTVSARSAFVYTSGVRGGRMLDKIGKYEVSEQIGVGGFGAVYRGRDPFIKRTVAIKTCQVNDEEIKHRFFREAELAGNLHHRHITTIYDFGVENGIPYIVQEFLTGEDLDKKIKRGDPIPIVPQGRDPDGDRRRARLRARRVDRAPRRQARQRAGPRRRHGQGHGLRDRQVAADRVEPDPDGHHARNLGVPRSRADPRRADRPAAPTSSRSASSPTSCSRIASRSGESTSRPCSTRS